MKKTKTKLNEESNNVPREDWFEQGARKKKSTTSEERSYKKEQHKKREKKARQIDRYWIKRLDEENCEKREEIVLIKKKNKIRKMTSEEGRAEWSGTSTRKKK